MCLLDDLVGKKILFYGPANTTDKKNINIDDYDFVVITNNSISYFFDGRDLKHCKVIHLSNCIYTTKFNKLHVMYNSKIHHFCVLNVKCNSILHDVGIDKNKVTNIFTAKERKQFRKSRPLGLNMFLLYMHEVPFESMYITGVTFYQGSKTIDGCYDDERYLIKAVHDRLKGRKNQSALDGNHELEPNIRKTIFFCDKYKNITYCDEMRDAMNMYKI